MHNLTNTTLFGKYEILSLLGTGNFGSVYLSKHKFLECYRAIKFIPKLNEPTASLLNEAQLLKSLHHPGIPTIYDVEEDDGYYYLIEEYIEGESLDAFLLRQSHISQDVFMDFCLQLCDIFLYLHTLKPSPIVYLDLKPEHIIVCGMQIKLIDFNVATYLTNLGNIFNLYGNENFSAPELKSGSLPNFLSDIYSIGKIVEYLSCYLDTSVSPNFHKIIKKATSVEPACRFETVDQLISAIKKEKKNLHQPHLRKKILVVGSHPGAGATHVSISLVCTLNYMGYDAIYYDTNQNNSLQKSTSYISHKHEHEGLIHYGLFRGYPLYGPGINLSHSNESFSVYNAGDAFPPFDIDADLILFVCDSSVWHRQEVYEKASKLMHYKELLIILCNRGDSSTMAKLAKDFSSCVYHYPYIKNPFSVTKPLLNLVTRILHLKRGNRLFSALKNIFSKKKSSDYVV